MELTQEGLKELLNYDPLSGVFTWKVKCSRSAEAGSKAGYLRTDGYILIGINGRKFLAHRLAWLYMTSISPKLYIDHINRIKDDNRFVNLRAASNAQNQANTNRRFSNTTGFKGTHKVGSKYKAQIKVGDKVIYLGSYLTPELAHAAYCVKAKQIHGEYFNAG